MIATVAFFLFTVADAKDSYPAETVGHALRAELLAYQHPTNEAVVGNLEYHLAGAKMEQVKQRLASLRENGVCLKSHLLDVGQPKGKPNEGEAKKTQVTTELSYTLTWSNGKTDKLTKALRIYDVECEPQGGTVCRWKVFGEKSP